MNRERQTTSGAMTQKWMSVQEAADTLGISKGRYYQLREEGLVPGTKLLGGRKIIILRSVFDDWLEQQYQLSMLQMRKKRVG